MKGWPAGLDDPFMSGTVHRDFPIGRAAIMLTYIR